MKKIRVGDFRLGVREKGAIKRVIDRGNLSEGIETRNFEKAFADYIETKYCVTANSGTSALMLGLKALLYHKKFRVKAGTKVITSPLNFIATTNAIVQTGFEPVYVDVDRVTFGMQPEGLEKHLQKNSKKNRDCSVVLPIHLMGYVCDMDKINKIARKYGLIVFEDAAQAHGSLYDGKKAGSLSDLSAFSFYIAHNIQAGEMGALLTNDVQLAKLARQLKAHGRLCDCYICRRPFDKCVKKRKGSDVDPRFSHHLIGFNFKTMEFQTSLALTQLEKVDEIFKKRSKNVAYLNKKLKKFSNILQLPLHKEEVSYLAYPIVVKNPKLISRTYLTEGLEENGVETRPLFGCIPAHQPAYRYLKKEYKGKLPNAEYLGKNAFYIGCHQYLSRDDLGYIAHIFEKVLGKA